MGLAATNLALARDINALKARITLEVGRRWYTDTATFYNVYHTPAYEYNVEPAPDVKTLAEHITKIIEPL